MRQSPHCLLWMRYKKLVFFFNIAKLAAYEIEEPVLDNFSEFLFGNVLYWGLAEGYSSEMSAKRTAMENATKNADEMIKKLTLTYNRGRQASITNDLVLVSYLD
jgi:F-type H+-transporting ATPase subunit gamma